MRAPRCALRWKQRRFQPLAPPTPLADTWSSNYQYISAGHNLPAYLAKTNYKEPTDINVNNYSDSDAENLNFFGRLQ